MHSNNADKLNNITYLDHNSTTFFAEGLYDFLAEYISAPLNPSSIHSSGRNARKLLEQAREKVAESLGFSVGTRQYKVIFTSGATEANNTIIGSFADGYVLYSGANHSSVISPAKKCANSIELKVDENGLTDQGYLEELLVNLQGGSQGKKVLVSIMAANNETGVIEPIKELSALAHKYGAYFHSDCTQIYGKMEFSIPDNGVDFASVSGHKIGALSGSGALIARDDFVVKPILSGGGQERGERSGTESMIPIISLGYAASMLPARIQAHNTDLLKLRDFIEDEILSISQSCDKATIIGRSANRLPNTSLISLKGLDSNVQLIKFDMEGICLSNGSACSSGTVKSSHVLKSMGFGSDISSSVIRVSFGLGNDMKDAMRFLEVWKEIYNKHA